MDCPHVHEFPETPNGQLCRCEKVTKAVGFNCSHPLKACVSCFDAGWYDKPIEDTPLLVWMVGCLRARIIAGDCPRYQAANPIDLDATFAQYAGLAPKFDQEDTLADAVRHWSRILEKDGGHPPEVIEEKANRIAETHNLERSLEILALGAD